MAEYELNDGTTIIDASLPIEADKNSVNIIDAGTISDDVYIDFSHGDYYKCIAASGTYTINASGLGIGQTGRIQILSDAVHPDLTFVGVQRWLDDEPTFDDDLLTIVTVFNDGELIIGSFVMEDLGAQT
jgi:hypothetical protein